MKKVILSIVSIFFAACGAVYTPNPFQKGHIAVIADAAGMKAFSDMQTGLVNEAKTSPDIKSSYFQHRDLAEQEDTKRAFAPNFLQGLFSTQAKEAN